MSVPSYANCNGCGRWLNTAIYFKLRRPKKDTESVYLKHPCRLCQRQQAKELRALKKNLIRPVRIPTRKHCSRCKHWRPSIDFRPKDKDRTGKIVTIQSWCAYCQKEEARERVGIKRTGEPYKTRGPRKGRTKKKVSDLTPEQLKKKRARDRRNAARRRRRDGVAIRGPWLRYRDEKHVVPVEPFREWLVEQKEADRLTLVADRAGVSYRRLTTIIEGSYWKKGNLYEVKNVTIEVVDQCLSTIDDGTVISHLYPTT